MTLPGTGDFQEHRLERMQQIDSGLHGKQMVLAVFRQKSEERKYCLFMLQSSEVIHALGPNFSFTGLLAVPMNDAKLAIKRLALKVGVT